MWPRVAKRVGGRASNRIDAKVEKRSRSRLAAKQVAEARSDKSHPATPAYAHSAG